MTLSIKDCAKDIKLWLAKQALWQVHTPPPKEINHHHYEVTKPSEQHQCDLLMFPIMPSSKANTSTCTCRGVVLITNAQLQSTKPKPTFCAG